jgi:hypothetical protein
MTLKSWKNHMRKRRRRPFDNGADQEGEKQEMKIDFEQLTRCAVKMVAGLEAHPLGSILLIIVLFAMATVGFAWK